MDRTRTLSMVQEALAKVREQEARLRTHLGELPGGGEHGESPGFNTRSRSTLWALRGAPHCSGPPGLDRRADADELVRTVCDMPGVLA